MTEWDSPRYYYAFSTRTCEVSSWTRFASTVPTRSEITALAARGAPAGGLPVLPTILLAVGVALVGGVAAAWLLTRPRDALVDVTLTPIP